MSADFRSDNVAPIAPEILAAIAAANADSASAYGDDPWTEGLAAKFSALFEREVFVFPVATGTASNALALSAVTPPWGVIFCYAQAYIRVDECGAPEFFSGGARVLGLAGKDGKLTTVEL